MRANLSQKNLIFLVLIFTVTTGIYARERVSFIVYMDKKSDYSRFMHLELKKALSLPLRKRKVHMERRGLEVLGESKIGNNERILLLLHTTDINEHVQNFIKKYAEDKRILIWITGDTSSKNQPGVDAITSASNNWKENEKALRDYVVPFVLEALSEVNQ